MDHQLAGNKWFPKREDQESELRFNPFPADHFIDQNQTQIPISTTYPFISSSLSPRNDHGNTISFAAAKSMPKSGVVERVSHSPVQINFSSSSSAAPVNTNTYASASFEEFYGAVEYDDVPVMKSGGSGRTSLQSQEHILAERKRRQKLSKSFIALSAIVPGLKKLDKASVLDGAINYLKKLEQQIKNMEENTSSNYMSTGQCHVSNKRTRGQSNTDGGGAVSSDDIENDVIMCSSQDLNQPEIDVKISGGNVLMRIFCQKIDGIFKEILFKVESLDLSIVNSSASPFGKFNLYIAILAQTEGDSCMSCEGLAKYIREVVQDFVGSIEHVNYQ